MRTTLSIVGAPPYGISKHLVNIIQPTLNRSKNKIKTSSTFIKETKEWRIDLQEIQVSYDVAN